MKILGKSFMLVVLAAFTLSAQQKETKTVDAPMDGMMKKWLEVSSPNEAHKVLGDLVGSWESTNTWWMEGPDKAPVVNKGTSEMKWILGGRFIQQEIKGEMMGMPFEGIGMTGYDNVRKMYVSLWMDNTSTGLWTSEGSYDAASKTLTLFGKSDDFMTGQYGKTVRYVTKIESKDKHVFEFHDETNPAGKTKMGEMVFTRKAAMKKDEAARKQ